MAISQSISAVIAWAACSRRTYMDSTAGRRGGRDPYLNWPPNGLTGVQITRGTLEQIVEAESIDGGSYTLSWRGDTRACFNGGPWSESPITVERLPFGQPIRVDFAGGTVGRVKL